MESRAQAIFTIQTGVTSSTTLVARLIEGTFPDYSTILKRARLNLQAILTADVGTMLTKLEGMKKLVADDSNTVSLRILTMPEMQKFIHLYGINGQPALHPDKKVNMDYQEEGVDLSSTCTIEASNDTCVLLNIVYLIDLFTALKAANVATVRIHINPSGPNLFEPAQTIGPNITYQHVIMAKESNKRPAGAKPPRAELLLINEFAAARKWTPVYIPEPVPLAPAA